jgi:hypothetical protein
MRAWLTHSCNACHQLVHPETAIAATKNMAQKQHLNKVRKTKRGNNWQQHAIRSELLHIDIEGDQLTI